MARKILIIRSGPLKHFIQCIPAFSAIRKFHQDAEISILTDKSLVKFCKQSGFFNKVWLDSKPEWFDVMGIYDVVKRIKNGNFTMVYDLDNTKRSEWYFRLIGFHKPLWNSAVIDWCSHPYIPTTTEENIHFQASIHNQLAVANIHEIPDVHLSYMKDRSKDSEAFNDLPKKFVMICAAGNKKKLAHKWDIAQYAEIIDILETRYGLKSVLIGDNDDDYWLNQNLVEFCQKAKPINYSGKTTLSGIISVANRAQFCLGNETAPTHVAAYTGCRTIMLCSRFSPPELLAPQVRNLAVIEEPALENVTTDRVLYTIEKFAMVADDESAYKLMEIDKSNNSSKESQNAETQQAPNFTEAELER